MKYITRNINSIFFLCFFLLAYNCNASSSQKNQLNILGDWKCVGHNYRGVQKYTFEQAEEIRQSILHIESHTCYFKGVKFIDRCSFDKWKMMTYKDFGEPILSLETTYTPNQLKKIFYLDTVDKNGNSACYNNCLIFITESKLITICGGYTFYWEKVKR